MASSKKGLEQWKGGIEVGSEFGGGGQLLRFTVEDGEIEMQALDSAVSVVPWKDLHMPSNVVFGFILSQQLVVVLVTNTFLGRYFLYTVFWKSCLNITHLQNPAGTDPNPKIRSRTFQSGMIVETAETCPWTLNRLLLYLVWCLFQSWGSINQLKKRIGGSKQS